MKAIFTVGWGIFVLSLVILSPAYAGMPDEDPLVRDLYERFRSGRLPTVAEMTAATSWECVSHSARPGKFERKLYQLGAFSRVGSALRLGNDPTLYFANRREWVQTWRTEYSGGHSITQFISFRIDDSGVLLSEGAGQFSEGLITPLKLPASTSATTSPRAYTAVFLECSPENH